MTASLAQSPVPTSSSWTRADIPVLGHWVGLDYDPAMATLAFEGESHDEIVQKVRRWLASVDGDPLASADAADVVNQSAEVTKDALRVLAEAAPLGVGQSDLFKALTTMGYKATDATKDAAIAGLDAMETATGGGVVKNVAGMGTKALYEMNTQVAKGLLKALIKD